MTYTHVSDQCLDTVGKTDMSTEDYNRGKKKYGSRYNDNTIK